MDVVALYPGRFQPFHQGHLGGFLALNNEFGNVQIVTTDKVDEEKSPFTFEEKATMMQLAGIPLRDIVQVKSPYTATEALSQYDGSNTAVVFGISAKDMDDDPRFSFEPQKSGKPSYFQPYQRRYPETKLEPFGDPQKPSRAYVMVLPTFMFELMGHDIDSASQIRQIFPELSFTEQVNFISGLYGRYSVQVHNIWQKRLIKNHMPSEKSKPNSSMSQSLIKNSDQCWTPLSAMPLLS